MLYCRHCVKELVNGSVRLVKIDGVEMVFCPTSYAVLPGDCLNGFLQVENYRKKMLADHCERMKTHIT